MYKRQPKEIAESGIDGTELLLILVHVSSLIRFGNVQYGWNIPHCIVNTAENNLSKGKFRFDRNNGPGRSVLGLVPNKRCTLFTG